SSRVPAWPSMREVVRPSTRAEVSPKVFSRPHRGDLAVQLDLGVRQGFYRLRCSVRYRHQLHQFCRSPDAPSVDTLGNEPSCVMACGHHPKTYVEPAHAHLE